MIACPHCGASYSVTSFESPGQSVRCLKCDRLFIFPTPPTAPPPPPAITVSPPVSAVQQVIHVQQETNTIGVAGFVLSLLAFLTCGALSPISLVLSLIGLNRQPNGLAIAGVILSVPGTMLILAIVFGFVTIVSL